MTKKNATKKKPKSDGMAINIGIEEEDRREIAEGLSRLFADTYIFYLITNNFYWNVTGRMFNNINFMFE